MALPNGKFWEEHYFWLVWIPRPTTIARCFWQFCRFLSHSCFWKTKVESPHKHSRFQQSLFSFGNPTCAPPSFKILVASIQQSLNSRNNKNTPVDTRCFCYYCSSTVAPAASSFFFSSSASSFFSPSLTTFGAPSTKSLASFKPKPVASRRTLIT